MESSIESHILTEPVDSAACPKCGAVLGVGGLVAFTPVQCSTCEFEFQVPAKFGDFTLLELLGAGGMGGVYRARDEVLNREVAVKVMLQSLGSDHDFVETFQREAQAAARLNHPNIAQIYSFGQVYGQPFIVMELISGGSLEEMMSEQGPLSPAVVIHVGVQIAEGLREAAEAGLVHGDVKPENILFDSERNAKLVDFGLAAMQSGPDNEVWGTPFYIAPEKVRRQKSDFRSDIYSLGATLYHAIAGVPPFDGADATEVVKARFMGPPKSLGDIRGSVVPSEVEALITRMLEMEPQMRFPTYGSLLGDMRRYLAKAGPVKLKTSSKRIMIKGRKPQSLTGYSGATGSLEVGADGMVPVSSFDSEATDDEHGKGGCKLMALIVVGVVLLITLLVGGFFGIRAMQKAKVQQRQSAQAQQTLSGAKSSIERTMLEAENTIERIKDYDSEALGYAKEAMEAVVDALGEEYRARLIVPEPLDDVETEEEAADAVAGDGAEGSDEAAEDTVKEDAAVAEEVEAVETAEGDDGELPVVGRVREMYHEAYRVKAAVAMARTMKERIATEAVKADELLRDESKAQEATKFANALVEQLNGLRGSRAVVESQQRVALLKKGVGSIRSDLELVLAQRKQAEVEAERRAKREAEAEKKRQQEEARIELERSEIAAVGVAADDVKEMLRQLQFRDAARTLTRAGTDLETAGGVARLELEDERVNRIREFHDYLVEKTPGFRSARGWSIDAADARNMTVGGKRIAWTEVYSEHLDIVVELVAGLVMDEQIQKELRLRDRTRLMTNAALFLHCFYADNARVMEGAAKLANDAARQFDLDADKIRKFMPDLFVEE